MKFAIIGDFATGKTSLIRRYVDNAFSADYRATIGSNVFIKKIELTHNTEQYLVSINLYEVAGQDRWQNVRKTYYLGSQGLIFVGDLSRKRTFHQLRDFWFVDTKEHIEMDIPKLIIANKCDLPEDIDDTEIRTISSEIGAFKFTKTSAKDNIGVNSAFVSMVTEILNSSLHKKNKSE
jgi:Ras-related protein Rab-32